MDTDLTEDERWMLNFLAATPLTITSARWAWNAWHGAVIDFDEAETLLNRLVEAECATLTDVAGRPIYVATANGIQRAAEAW
jgi:hypothetical protein